MINLWALYKETQKLGVVLYLGLLSEISQMTNLSSNIGLIICLYSMLPALTLLFDCRMGVWVGYKGVKDIY